MHADTAFSSREVKWKHLVSIICLGEMNFISQPNWSPGLDSVCTGAQNKTVYNNQGAKGSWCHVSMTQKSEQQIFGAVSFSQGICPAWCHCSSSYNVLYMYWYTLMEVSLPGRKTKKTTDNFLKNKLFWCTLTNWAVSIRALRLPKFGSGCTNNM